MKSDSGFPSHSEAKRLFGWDRVLSLIPMTVSELTVYRFPHIANAVLLITKSSLTSGALAYRYVIWLNYH